MRNGMNAECGMGNGECGMGNAEWGMRNGMNAEWGMRNAEWGMRAVDLASRKDAKDAGEDRTYDRTTVRKYERTLNLAACSLISDF